MFVVGFHEGYRAQGLWDPGNEGDLGSLGHSSLVAVRISDEGSEALNSVPLNAIAMFSCATFARAQECPHGSPLSPDGPW